MTILYGVDFSGDNGKWSAGCRTSNVWVARAVYRKRQLILEELHPVQQLKGGSTPFIALSRALNSSKEIVAAIDAPFSLPCTVSSDAPEVLWQKTASLTPIDRHFPRGHQIISAFAPGLGPSGKKLLRDTEVYWQKQGLNPRSTVWAGPRGGAPFTAACMTLLSRHAGTVWPLTEHTGSTLVEGYPAAQLRQWQLPHQGYNGPQTPAKVNRRKIIIGLVKEGLVASDQQLSQCLESADALDAVVCLFAAKAWATDRLAHKVGRFGKTEGHITVHA